ncbi:2-C-methyl-D-erythritol 2,4-cyclodiphosphate synthase, chloroplastic-like [Chenopodium quinoa]|uniref:2-C-methyl-D-erythritol 2,4-cyclodiphosphate synthase, chloroplastic-like n=1 Tax=Chenopodium quinoa TaxID=63459 RepID=UPI000B77F0DA|nr:2-C-methyl-D-erythritol 2,4-cyclodiphosphate synthase, chloroplastic-like [Chenopodium quinoa]
MAMTTALCTCSFLHTTTQKPLLSLSSSSHLSHSLPYFTLNTKNLNNSALKPTNSFSISAVSTPIAETSQPTSLSNSKPSKSLPFRVGHGFDLHRLEPGYPLIIGGIDIPHDKGCEAHSDGDVLLHCVVDAILGALGLPDIGQLFPDNDPKWKGAASSVFIKEAVRLMDEAGYELGNLDATLILQRPKVSPHKEAIKANLSALLGVDPSVLNLKAKTHEKVDSLGENRSIAAHTVVLLMKK